MATYLASRSDHKAGAAFGNQVVTVVAEKIYRTARLHPFKLSVTLRTKGVQSKSRPACGATGCLASRIHPLLLTSRTLEHKCHLDPPLRLALLLHMLHQTTTLANLALGQHIFLTFEGVFTLLELDMDRCTHDLQ